MQYIVLYNTDTIIVSFKHRNMKSIIYDIAAKCLALEMSEKDSANNSNKLASELMKGPSVT